MGTGEILHTHPMKSNDNPSEAYATIAEAHGSASYTPSFYGTFLIWQVRRREQAPQGRVVLQQLPLHR